MKRIVYFRADADSEIGYGHFMRTLALAEVLSSQFDCRFATKAPTDFQRNCLKEVCQLIELPSDASRFDFFANMIIGGEIVVLDNYFYDQDYERLLRQRGASVLLIDNLHIRHTCADAVLGFAMGLKETDYSVEPYTKLYLGPAYSLLRKPFIEQLAHQHPPIKDFNKLNIVVSFGGSERSELLITIAKMLSKLDVVNKVTAIGGSQIISDSKKITYKNKLSADEMRDEFINNDIAILPASTTLFEALACGILIIGGFIVDNQILNYENILKCGGIIGCGNFMDVSNQKRLLSIVGSETIKKCQKKTIIPQNLENNLLSIFKSLS